METLLRLFQKPLLETNLLVTGKEMAPDLVVPVAEWCVGMLPGTFQAMIAQ